MHPAIRRIDFIGFTVAGPMFRAKAGYLPAEWPGWKVEVRGPQVALTPPASEPKSLPVLVPVTRCVLYLEPTVQAPPRPVAAQPTGPGPAVRRRAGRKPAAPPPPPELEVDDDEDDEEEDS